MPYLTKEALQNNIEKFSTLLGQKYKNISSGLEYEEFHMLQDTDVYAESALAASQNDGYLLIKCGGDVVDCSKLVSSHMTECVVPLHILTGRDRAFSFYGRGRRICAKTLGFHS